MTGPMSRYSSRLVSTCRQIAFGSSIRPTCRALRVPIRKLSTTPSTHKSQSYALFSYLDSWIVEDLGSYRPGGYHPVVIGDTLNERYHVVHKLGHGSYSTIWLARDRLKETYVTVKINSADFQSEQAIIQTLLSDSSYLTHPGWPKIPILQDHFKSQSPNGCHECYVTSPARMSLVNATDTSYFHIDIARHLVVQLIHAVVYVHSRGVIHGDIHIGNILLDFESSLDNLSVSELYNRFGEPTAETIQRDDEKPLAPGVPTHATEPMRLGKYAHEITFREARLILSDFGEAFSPPHKSEPKLGKDCKSPRYCLPPEAYFEPQRPISSAADIWTLACAIWHIICGRQLFSSFFPDSDQITCQHMDHLGPLPSEWWAKWEARNKYFDEDMQPKGERDSAVPIREFLFEEMEKTQVKRDKWSSVEMDKQEMNALLDMLEPMLAYRPELRATTATILGSEWMVNWGSPSYGTRAHRPESWLSLSSSVLWSA